MLNSSDTATRVRSPEESRWIRWVRLPRGAAWMSISLSSGSSGLASRRSHSPPPNRVWKTCTKLAWIALKVSRNMVRAVPSISRMACCSEPRAETRSSRWLERNAEPLALLGVFLDRERVDRTDGLQGAHDPRRLESRGSRGRGRVAAPRPAARRSAAATRSRSARRCSGAGRRPGPSRAPAGDTPRSRTRGGGGPRRATARPPPAPRRRRPARPRHPPRRPPARGRPPASRPGSRPNGSAGW